MYDEKYTVIDLLVVYIAAVSSMVIGELWIVPWINNFIENF